MSFKKEDFLGGNEIKRAIKCYKWKWHKKNRPMEQKRPDIDVTISDFQTSGCKIISLILEVMK